MRHSKKRHKLGVSGPHRSAMLGNLSVALITHGSIRTTLAKAKALRPFIEKIITLAKKAEVANDAARKLHFRRLAIARVRDKRAVAQLFDTRVSEFIERNGGYTRIYKLGQRVGDAAEMALIELIDGGDEGYPKRPAKKANKQVDVPAAEVCEVPTAETTEACEVPAAEACQMPTAETTEACQMPTAETTEACQMPTAETTVSEVVEHVDASTEAPADDAPASDPKTA